MPILGLLGALLTAPREARANSGDSFLETMGVSIAVGTVLGASTLPFYTDPGSNLINLAYGASAGVVVGFGIWVYGLIKGSSQESFLDAGQSRPGLRIFAANTNYFSFRQTSAFVDCNSSKQLELQIATERARPTLFWTPLVSLTW